MENLISKIHFIVVISHSGWNKAKFNRTQLFLSGKPLTSVFPITTPIIFWKTKEYRRPVLDTDVDGKFNFMDLLYFIGSNKHFSWGAI